MITFSLIFMLKTSRGAEEEPCFKCSNSHLCISYSNRCDQKKDCPTGDDEDNCIPSEICPYKSGHRCSDSGDCISLSQLCDRKVDCEYSMHESCSMIDSWLILHHTRSQWWGWVWKLLLYRNDGSRNLQRNSETEISQWSLMMILIRISVSWIKRRQEPFKNSTHRQEFLVFE